MAPVRVLHVVTIMDRGGLETMLMTQYRKIDREKVQYDFLVHRQECGAYDDEIEAMGGRIFRAQPMTPFGIPAYEKWLLQFFMGHPEYAIIHSSLNELSGFVLWAAKKAGIKTRIAHSHIAKTDYDWKYLFRVTARHIIPFVATDMFVCSRDAGDWCFGKCNRNRFRFIPNAIDTQVFSYHEEMRNELREKLGLENNFVIGHVGRFFAQKNHTFLLDIFTEIHKKDDSARLLLIGGGPLMKEMQKKAEPLGSAVIFAGVQTNVADYYQAMDVFAFPSLFEGLGIVAVEAQTSGLPCFLADTVPDEAAITPITEKIPLSKSAEYWADKIITSKSIERIDRTQEIYNGKYDVTAAAEYMQEFYLGRYK